MRSHFRVFAAAVAFSPVALAEDESLTATETESTSRFTASVEAGIQSSYYSRGTYVFESVANLQPALTIGADLGDFGTVDFGVASFIPVMLRDELADVRDEVDFTFSWSRPFADIVSASAGVTTISVFQANFHTQEVFASLDVALPAGFAASVGVWGDVNLFKGAYYRAAVSWSDSWLDDKLSFSIEVNHGGAHYHNDVYHPLELGSAAELSYDLGGGASIAASAVYNYNPHERSSQWSAGLTTAYVF